MVKRDKEISDISAHNKNPLGKYMKITQWRNKQVFRNNAPMPMGREICVFGTPKDSVVSHILLEGKSLFSIGDKNAKTIDSSKFQVEP